MIGTLPMWAQDVMDLWPLWAAIGSLIGAWIVWSLRTWLKVNVADPIAQVRRHQDRHGEELAATRHLVQYHLGPNGKTKPMHRRVADIERANGIEADPPDHWPPRLDPPEVR